MQPQRRRPAPGPRPRAPGHCRRSGRPRGSSRARTRRSSPGKATTSRTSQSIRPATRSATSTGRCPLARGADHPPIRARHGRVHAARGRHRHRNAGRRPLRRDQERSRARMRRDPRLPGRPARRSPGDSVFGNSAGVERFPARHGLSHLDFILDRAEHALAGAEAPADVSAVIEFFLHTRRERSLVLLVTDQLWRPGRREAAAADPGAARAPGRQDRRHASDGEGGRGDGGDLRERVPSRVRPRRRVLRKEIEHRRREREEAASALLARYKVLNAPVASSADVLPVIVRLLRGQHREQ